MLIVITTACLHANYQKFGGIALPMNFVRSPEGHGWVVTDGETCITWMDCNPAPNEVYKFLIYRKNS